MSYIMYEIFIKINNILLMIVTFYLKKNQLCLSVNKSFNNLAYRYIKL